MHAKRTLLWASIAAALVAVVGASRPGELPVNALAPRPTSPDACAETAVETRVESRERVGGADAVPARAARVAPLAEPAGETRDAHDRDACCELVVRLTRGTAPISGRVTILAGLSSGPSAAVEGEASFEHLYPGLHLVRVETPLGTAERVVRLEGHRPARLELDFDGARTVHGRIVDRDGRAVAGARVTLDGIEGTSDPSGEFALVRAAAGPAYLTVRAPGFAYHGSATEGSDLLVRLEREARLVLEDGADARVVLNPRGARSDALFPWHWIEARLAAGERELDGLPACELAVRVSNAEAAGERRVHLVAGEERRTQATPLRAEPPAESLREELARRGTHGRALRSHLAFAWRRDALSSGS